MTKLDCNEFSFNCNRNRSLLLPHNNLIHSDTLFRRINSQRFTRLDSTGLHFTGNNCFFILVWCWWLQNRENERLVLYLLICNHTNIGCNIFQRLDYSWASIPCSILWVRNLVDTLTRKPTTRHPKQLVVRKPDLIQKLDQLLFDIFISFMRPLYGVHFVHGHNDSLDIHTFRQQSVLLSLSIKVETRFEGIYTTVNRQDSHICLWNTSNGVWYKVSVTRCINDGKIGIWSIEVTSTYRHCYTTFSFFLSLVHNPG